MEWFEFDDIINVLIEYGVDCVEMFCFMIEFDFKEIGFNIG